MKRKILVKFFAHYDLKVSDALVNRIHKKYPEISIRLLEDFYKKFHDRPLFIPEVEREIYLLETKIISKHTNKRIYKRKGRRIE